MRSFSGKLHIYQNIYVVTGQLEIGQQKECGSLQWSGSFRYPKRFVARRAETGRLEVCLTDTKEILTGQVQITVTRLANQNVDFKGVGRAGLC